MQKLIGKMQFPGVFSANCGQDCGIPRGIVKHSFGNQIYIQCKLLPPHNIHSKESVRTLKNEKTKTYLKSFFVAESVKVKVFGFIL